MGIDKGHHNISCSSGTDALLLALHGLELQRGQGVIVPSFTFAATAEVMPTMGAIPIFAEVEADSFNLDPKKLEVALVAGQAAGVEVVGIIGVGLFGQPANYDAIRKFAKTHGLWLIDDAAQSFGAQWQGSPVGQLADVTCTSPQNMALMVTSAQSSIMTRLLILSDPAGSWHGQKQI